MGKINLLETEIKMESTRKKCLIILKLDNNIYLHEIQNKLELRMA